MINHGKHNILGVGVDAVDYEYTVAEIITAAHAHRTLTVTALAVHGVMTGALDAIHRHRLNQFDLVVPDGQPVRWSLNWLNGIKLPDRVYGPTLTRKVCMQAAVEKLPIYLYGSRPEVLSTLTSNLQAEVPGLQVVGQSPSLFRQTTATEKEAIAATIRDSGARIVFVGLGCPRQETWIYEYRDLLPMALLAVGAAFDFHAGTVPQAPARWQNAGFEWLFRLMQEPRRLWKRYLYLNPLFLILLMLQYLKVRVVPLTKTLPPSTEMRYG